MTPSLVWKEQTRFIEDAVETWKRAHDEALQALELDAVLQVCAVLGDYIQKRMAVTWEELFSGQLSDVQEQGAYFQKCFEQSVEAFAAMEDVARESRDTGHELSHYPPFVAAHEQLLRLKDDFERRWPYFRADALQAKLAAPAEFVDAEEIYREFPELRRPDQK